MKKRLIIGQSNYTEYTSVRVFMCRSSFMFETVPTEGYKGREGIIGRNMKVTEDMRKQLISFTFQHACLDNKNINFLMDQLKLVFGIPGH